MSTVAADTAAVAERYFAALADRDVEAMVALWAPGGREFIRGQVDTTAPDLLAELTSRCREVLDARLTRSMDHVALATGLLPSLQVRPADPERGPWPAWFTASITAGTALLAAVVFLLYRRIRRRTSRPPSAKAR